MKNDISVEKSSSSYDYIYDRQNDLNLFVDGLVTSSQLGGKLWFMVKYGEVQFITLRSYQI